ncbi:MAG: protein kinase, partial [Planctomycetales bacterium]|nr:protein kinase [Planctomycetales bacterium]
IHRDLKPENVMLGDYGEVLVMDWGLARISPNFPNAASVSQSSAMGGTPAYMAPEMATGPIDRITAASDVYLLGAILHEVITGKPPHRGGSVMQCLLAASKNDIVPTDACGELYDVARRAMATVPEDRYENVKSLQDAVRRYQAHSESIKLTEHAAAHLVRAADAEGYDLFARTVYGLEEALSLWKDNERAAKLLHEARLAYADNAYEHGDLDLSASLLDEQNVAHQPLLAKIAEAQRERRARQRALRLLKGAVATLVAVVLGVVAFAYAAVSQQRDKAVFERDRAVRAEGEAKQNFEEAERQRQLAQTNEAEAVANAQLAETRRQEASDQRNAAVAARQLAEEQREEADRQRGLAVAARQAEEYAAYVARIGLTRAKIEENAFDSAGELLAQCAPELRHWEWGRLQQLCQLSTGSWPLEAPGSAVAWSPRGDAFAVGDWSGKLSVYDPQGDRPRFQHSQGQYVHTVAYDHTGRRLASAGSDREIHILDAASGELVQRLTGHEDAVLSVEFSPDGRWLASSGYDKTARLWDLETGQLAQTLKRHSWWVCAARFSPDGRRLLTAGQDGKAVVWQRTANPDAQFAYFTEFVQHRGAVYDAGFFPDGRHVATAGYDGRVLVWNPDEVRPPDVEARLEGRPDPPAPFVELLGHQGPVRAVAFAPQTKQLATGGQDNTIILWDADAARPAKTLRGHASHVRGLSFSPDGSTLLSVGRDRQVKRWSPGEYAERQSLASDATGEALMVGKFSRDGAAIVTAGRDRTARLWNARSGENLGEFAEGHDYLATSAEFFDGGARLATGAGDGSVRIWDVTTGAEVAVLSGTGTAAALDVTADGKWAATGGPDDMVRVWDVQKGIVVAELIGHEAEVTAVCFAGDGKTLATADRRGRGRVWRVADVEGAAQWTLAAELRGHSRMITAIEFVDGDRRLVTASGDNTCGQWNAVTGEEYVDRVWKHPDWVSHLVVNADQRVALTCCDDGKLRL